MKLPGGRYLHGWDLAVQRVSLDDVLRSCEEVGLTGFVDLQLDRGAGMVLYYLGSEVSAVYRHGPVGYHGPDALEKLRGLDARNGSITVYELPLEMAHVLRGVTNRRRLPEPLQNAMGVDALLVSIKETERTGMIEVHAEKGNAVLLLVSGRISSMYWEPVEGATVENAAALAALREGLGHTDATVYVSDFSRETWKSRHGAQFVVPGRVEPDAKEGPGDREARLRQELLAQIDQALPGIVQAQVFDLMTGRVLARRNRGTTAIRTALLLEKIPTLIQYARELVASSEEDEVEILEMQTARRVAVVGIARETHEALAVIADKAQPTSHIAARVSRALRDYTRDIRSAAQLSREPVPAPVGGVQDSGSGTAGFVAESVPGRENPERFG